MNDPKSMAFAYYLVSALVIITYCWLSRKVDKLPRIPLGWLLVYLIWSLIEIASRPFAWANDWREFLQIGSVILFYWALVRLAIWVTVELPLRFRHKDPLPDITRDFIFVVIGIVLIFVVLRVKIGVDLAQLMTTSAVLTAVVGLAAQTPLKSLFSGLVLRMERALKIGDYIKFSEYRGKVVGITWKSTQLLTLENELIFIPNTEMVNVVFRNLSRPSQRRIILMHIGLPYETPPNKARRVILAVLRDHPDVPNTPSPEVRLLAFDDFSIQYEIRFWHEKIDTSLATKAEINNNLWYALRRNGISIPFPIRDVRLSHLKQKKEDADRQANLSEISQIMASVSVLDPLSDSEIARLAEDVHLMGYGVGDRIVREGESGDSMFIVLSGRCQVISSQSHHRLEDSVTTIGRGDFFGEMSLLTGESRSATVQAMEDTEIIKVDKQTFSTIVHANPAVLEAIGRIMSKRQEESAAQKGDTNAPKVQPLGVARRIMSFFGHS